MYIIGVGTNEKVSSKLIRLATRGWCSHAWIELHQAHVAPVALHAELKDGVHWESIDEVWDRYPRRRRFVTRYDLAPGIEAVTSRPVLPYVLNCASLVAVALQESGVPHAGELGTVVTPLRLYNYLDGLPL
jgi:hypothetical protein